MGKGLRQKVAFSLVFASRRSIPVLQVACIAIGKIMTSPVPVWRLQPPCTPFHSLLHNSIVSDYNSRGLSSMASRSCSVFANEIEHKPIANLGFVGTAAPNAGAVGAAGLQSTVKEFTECEKHEVLTFPEHESTCLRGTSCAKFESQF